MALIETIDGLIPEEQLEIVTSEQENTDAVIVMAREYKFQGRLVRRDVWVTSKRGAEIGARQGAPG